MSFQIRKAIEKDIPAIVRLYSDDFLGAQRERYAEPLPKSYYDAFVEINSNSTNYLMIAELEKKVVGTLQLTIIPNLTFQGGKRGLVEGVHIDKSCQGKGFGKLMLQWAIDKSRELNCRIIELTSNKKRVDAIEFYKKLGFVTSHEGLKLYL